MIKLAMIRKDGIDGCPFGLSITSSCSNVGKLIYNMVPLSPKQTKEEQLNIINNNQENFVENADGSRCPYASKILSDKDAVECDYEPIEEPTDTLAGSPYYVQQFPGTGLNGLYAPPIGYNGDNPVDRGNFGDYFSTNASGKPANKYEYSEKTIFSIKDREMSLAAKFAQLGLDGVRIKPEDLSIFDDLKELSDDEDLGDLRVDLDVEPEDEDEFAFLKEGPELHGKIELEDNELDVDEDDNEAMSLEKEFSFTLPKLKKIPGADDDEEIISEPELEVEEDDNDLQVESDPWKWDIKTFMEWLAVKMDENSPQFPRHSGKEIVGLERLISYFKRILGEVSKALRVDYNNILPSAKLEAARDEMLNAVKRCEERVEKIEAFKRPKKKKANVEGGLVKEAGTARFQVQVPILLSYICRCAINSFVSGGHSIEETFQKLAKKFELTDREKVSCFQILADMNFPVRRDRGFLSDEEIDTTSSDNFDWSAQYPS